MTTIDPTFSVRAKIISALKNDAELNALVPSARVYPAKTPATVTWPFIRVPMLTGTVAELDGGSGSDQSGVVHCFTKASTTSPDPEVQAATINRHIVRVLSSIDAVDLGQGESMGVHVVQTQILQDPSEADAFHGIVQIRATAS